MRLLLPPSEGKLSANQGEPLALNRLSHPTLTEPRRVLIEALVTLCSTQPEQALSCLGLSPAQSQELTRNQTLWTAPTAPAWQIYSGVLYSQLDPASLTRQERACLDKWVWISSALFGFVSFSDPIPAYRLSGETRLPSQSSLAAYWQSALSPLLGSEPGLIVDLRSESYRKLAPLPTSVLECAVSVGVLQRQTDGTIKRITHFNKATKGKLVRILAQHAMPLATAQDLRAFLEQQGMEVQLLLRGMPKLPPQLEITLDIL
jgi:uncharacterized protein